MPDSRSVWASRDQLKQRGHSHLALWRRSIRLLVYATLNVRTSSIRSSFEQSVHLRDRSHRNQRPGLSRHGRKRCLLHPTHASRRLPLGRRLRPRDHRRTPVVASPHLLFSALRHHPHRHEHLRTLCDRPFIQTVFGRMRDFLTTSPQASHAASSACRSRASTSAMCSAKTIATLGLHCTW